jgi:Rrf2 family iron-sulfur cluster assembly transcriptional regulator
MTNRAQHAISAMIKLYEHQDKNPVPLSAIAEQDNISISYLEQLFAGLRKHGIVKSTLGPGGGYELAKEPQDICISDIMIAAEDSAPARRSKQSKQLRNSQTQSSPTYKLWTKLNQMILKETSTLTLNDIAQDNTACN